MKNFKLFRVIALILCAAMIMCMFTACNKKPDPNNNDDPSENDGKSDWQLIYEHIEPDTPVLKIGDVEICWDVFYYYFYQEVLSLYSQQGEVYDWTAEYSNGESYIVYCAEEAIYNYLRDCAGAEHFAKEYNVDVTQEQWDTYEENRQVDIELYGSEEAMLEYMDSMFLSENTAKYLAKISYLKVNAMDAAVGVNGEKIPDEDILVMADVAYKSIKVIPIPISDADGNPLSDDEKAVAYEKAQTILNEVKSVGSNDELDAKFDELIDQYAEPEMVDELKGGYTFSRGRYNVKVERAANDTEIGTYYDGIVEGDDYYYVFMRRPVDLESHAYYGSEYGFDANTLRYIYRDDIFDNMFWEWADSAEVEYYDPLRDIDFDAILGLK